MPQSWRGDSTELPPWVRHRLYKFIIINESLVVIVIQEKFSSWHFEAHEPKQEQKVEDDLNDFKKVILRQIECGVHKWLSIPATPHWCCVHVLRTYSQTLHRNSHIPLYSHRVTEGDVLDQWPIHQWRRADGQILKNAVKCLLFPVTALCANIKYVNIYGIVLKIYSYI